MKTIVQYFGDEATKAAYKTGAHGALCDAEALCSVSNSSKLYDRFKDWLNLVFQFIKRFSHLIIESLRLGWASGKSRK